ncbi:MAG: chromophore lyase CpcT/CpeT [Silvanigrellaceae bacterium]
MYRSHRSRKSFAAQWLSAAMLIAFFSAFASSLTAFAAEKNPLVNNFADLLTGMFDSSSQAIDDSEYLDVTVHHCAITVNNLPRDKRSGRFLALRQSVSTSDSPYRVRVLRIFAGENSDVVRVSSYGTMEGINLSDVCFKPENERMIGFAQLAEEKCTTESHYENGRFVGGTTGEGCPSSRAGAVRMTSEITLDGKGMTTWDRGWNAAGQVVWGPEKGPYRFERVTAQDVRLAQLASFFSGSFSNAEQVAQDPKNFIPVSYQFCQIDAAQNPLRPFTRLMLAQQTVSTPARTIQRNRVYEFFRNADGKIGIRTNPFEESKVPVDVCQRDLAERRMIADEALAQKDSCVLSFEWNEAQEAFTGSTPAEGCPSNFQGAVKFTLEEVIKDGLISPWERWFNAQGEQVAGSKVGPYIYKRISKTVNQ